MFLFFVVVFAIVVNSGVYIWLFIVLEVNSVSLFVFSQVSATILLQVSLCIIITSSLIHSDIYSTLSEFSLFPFFFWGWGVGGECEGQEMLWFLVMQERN